MPSMLSISTYTTSLTRYNCYILSDLGIDSAEFTRISPVVPSRKGNSVKPTPAQTINKHLTHKQQTKLVTNTNWYNTECKHVF